MDWSKAKEQLGGSSQLLSYLRGIRVRLIRVLVVLAVGFVAGFLFAPQLLEIVTAGVDELIYLAPAEAMFVQLRLAFAFAVTIALPFFISDVVLFAGRTLPWRRKLGLWAVVLFGGGMFAGGVLFGYHIVLPAVLTFLLSFASDKVRPLLALANYVSFVFGIVVPFGLVFQLPLTMATLARIGVVSPQTMVGYRRYAIVSIFIVSAFLTPPDAVSQVLMAGPVVGLYEVGLLLARLAWRTRARSGG